MADEIPDQNRLSVWQSSPGRWTARIGPPGLGIERTDQYPQLALMKAVGAMILGGWIFDPSWKPDRA